MKKRLLIAGLVVLLVLSALVTIGAASANSLVAPMSRFIFPQVLAVFQHGIKATQAYADHIGDLRSTFTLPWSVIGSGGIGGTAGDYTIQSTMGQPVAGSVSGGDFMFTSGFWVQALLEWIEIYLPLVLR